MSELVGHRQPYDSENANFNGQEVLVHATAYSTALAIRQEQPDRVFSFTHANFLMVSTAVSFRDKVNRVHLYEAILSGEKAQEITGKLWNAIDESEAQEADGVIKVDPESGDVYFVYETEDPDVQEKLDRQMNAWRKDVGKILDTRIGNDDDDVILQRDGYFQYLKVDDENIVVDFTSGKEHRVTVLKPKEGYPLDFVSSTFPGHMYQDNSPVVRWVKTLTNK